MGGDGFSTVFGAIVGAAFFIISLTIYWSLLRQVTERLETTGPAERRFGLPEAVLAVGFILLFAMNTMSGSGRVADLRTRDLIANVIFAIGLVLLIVIFLKVRRFNVTQLAGFDRLGAMRAVATGFVLLLAAYPLIVAADWFTQRVAGTGSSRQGIIELFSGTPLFEQRIIIILLAVVIAPVTEEFIFRFFLYGVLRRYAGRAVGIVVSSLIFSAVHAHLPSFAPLFMLGVCFTLAYDWSGSLLVSMTMHSIFNSLTLIALAYPQSFSQ